MTLDARSERNVAGVHADLVAVVRHAAELAPASFIVIEGLRTLARQRELLAQKKTQTLKSRHITGHAVDLMDAKGSWDFAKYRAIAATVKAAALALHIPIEWGGDWTSFKDGPHFQLPFAQYPG